MERTKVVEVIATRDSLGALVIWESWPHLMQSATGLWVNAGCGGGFVGVMSFDALGKAFIGGTFCGIPKGGMKRLRITTTVEEVK